MSTSPHPPSSTAQPPAPEGEQPCAGPRTAFGWAVSIFSAAFKKSASAAVADLPGGPRGYLILDAISRGQPRSQLALAQRLGVDKTAMTYLLDELESAKLVTRRPDPADRRARLVGITDVGTRVLTSSRQQLDVTEQGLLAVLDPSEANAFRLMLERIAIAAQTEAPDLEAITSPVAECE